MPRLLAPLIAAVLLAPAAAESLWVESLRAEAYPTLRLVATPFDRVTWRDLSGRRVAAEVDSAPAELRGVRAAASPATVYFLVDRAAGDPAVSAGLTKLARGALKTFPPGTRARTYALRDTVKRLAPGGEDPRQQARALGSMTAAGAYAPLRRGLERVLEDRAESPRDRELLVVLSASRDPGLAAGQHTRREVLRRVRAAGLRPAVFSLGSGVDRSFLRALGEGSGGLSLHSWSPRTLKTGLKRLAIGIGLAHEVTLTAPDFARDGATRRLRLRRQESGRELVAASFRVPGEAPSLAAAGDPDPAVDRAGVGDPASPHETAAPAADPGRETAPGAAAGRAARPAPATRPPPPRFRLGGWPIAAADQPEAERDITYLLDARLRQVDIHADAGLNRALGALERVLKTSNARLANGLYRQAKLSLSFLGSTYAAALKDLEARLDAAPLTRGVRAGFAPTQRRHLADLRRRWDEYKAALAAWSAHLPEAR